MIRRSSGALATNTVLFPRDSAYPPTLAHSPRTKATGYLRVSASYPCERRLLTPFHLKLHALCAPRPYHCTRFYHDGPRGPFVLPNWRDQNAYLRSPAGHAHTLTELPSDEQYAGCAPHTTYPALASHALGPSSSLPIHPLLNP